MNGWAAGQIPVQDNTPPFSKRCDKACTAGASKNLANNLLAAFDSKACAKSGQPCRQEAARQGGERPQPANKEFTPPLVGWSGWERSLPLRNGGAVFSGIGRAIINAATQITQHRLAAPHRSGEIAAQLDLMAFALQFSSHGGRYP